MAFRTAFVDFCAFLVMTVAGLALPRAALASQAISNQGCALLHMGPLESRSTSCMSCHPTGSGSNHPVDVDYRSSAGARSSARALRSTEEVVKRGVYLAEGKVHCLTCHDPRSPWKNHIALPPGAKPMPAVNPRDPASYEEGPVREHRIAALRASSGGERQAVSPKPLCLSCHALD